MPASPTVPVALRRHQGLRFEARAIVGDGDLQQRWRHRHRDEHRLATAVLHRVAQCLLRDAVGRGLHCRRVALLVALGHQPHRHRRVSTQRRHQAAQRSHHAEVVQLQRTQTQADLPQPRTQLVGHLQDVRGHPGQRSGAGGLDHVRQVHAHGGHHLPDVVVQLQCNVAALGFLHLQQPLRQRPQRGLGAAQLLLGAKQRGDVLDDHQTPRRRAAAALERDARGQQHLARARGGLDLDPFVQHGFARLEGPGAAPFVFGDGAPGVRPPAQATRKAAHVGITHAFPDGDGRGVAVQGVALRVAHPDAFRQVRQDLGEQGLRRRLTGVRLQRDGWDAHHRSMVVPDRCRRLWGSAPDRPRSTPVGRGSQMSDSPASRRLVRW